MIPLKQTCKIRKAASVDAWGQPVPGTAKSYPCRIDESSEMVRDSNGKEAVSRASILIKGLVKIFYSDTVDYTDETGNSYSYRPLSIAILRGVNGKAMFTKVVV
jgi:hypothetical protein